jgi:predicted membrane protein
MENNIKGTSKQDGRILAGLILVAVGGVILLRNTGVPLPGWLFSWPMILILAGFYIGFRSKFRNSTSLILIAVGGFFLANKFIPGLHLAPFFWPAIFIGAGLMFILKPGFAKKSHGKWYEKDEFTGFENSRNYRQPNDSFTHAATDINDTLQVSSVFSGVKRNIVSKNFHGGKVNCVFGGTQIDLTQADIQGSAEIKFDVVFGGVELVVPSHWKVFNEIDGVFHGVDDDRKYYAAVDSAPEKILVLKGSLIFGGIEIKSYK